MDGDDIRALREKYKVAPKLYFSTPRYIEKRLVELYADVNRLLDEIEELKVANAELAE